MGHYRLTDLDLSTRITLSLQMLDPDRRWGEASRLAREYGVSRKFIYQLRNQSAQALQEALAPQPVGRKPREAVLTIDHDFVCRAILVLATAMPGTLRAMQLVLELLFGQHCALGFISELLQACGEAARRYHATLQVPLPVLAEADEVFQGRQPCLTVVDGRSFLVLNLAAADNRDGTTWGVTWLELLAQGIRFQDVSSDGALGIQAGMRDAQLNVPWRPDLFHLLRDGQRITRKLEAAAYQAIAQAERAQQVEQEARTAGGRRGRPKSSSLSSAQAQVKEQVAIERYDSWCWLFSELRQALQPFDAQGRRTSVAQARQTVETVAQLLIMLGGGQVKAFAQRVIRGHLEELLAPLAWLEQTLAPYRQHLDPEIEAFLVWVWQHRHELEREIADPQEPWPDIAPALWSVLDTFHRASSLAESLHSWLRPHLHAHRGLPDWLLPLLQVFWNHHPFQRGKRKGKSPVEWAGVEQARSLTEVLELLLHPRSLEEAIS
jgi:hypothetical protein